MKVRHLNFSFLEGHGILSITDNEGKTVVYDINPDQMQMLMYQLASLHYGEYRWIPRSPS